MVKFVYGLSAGSHSRNEFADGYVISITVTVDCRSISARVFVIPCPLPRHPRWTRDWITTMKQFHTREHIGALVMLALLLAGFGSASPAHAAAIEVTTF